VLNALKANIPAVQSYPFVSNNHFDVDGFIGIWSLLNPELALQHETLLRKMALLGDFREGMLETDEDSQALKLVCWINSVERREFYAPFASSQSEATHCVPKYQFFLNAFEKVLLEPNNFRQDWTEEYEQVVQDWQVLASPQSRVQLEQDIRLLIVETPEPLHYYALFGQSYQADAVLCLYHGNRYELEYKYTSWIDTAHRLSFPRLNLELLTHQLNQIEESPFSWKADKITDTGPILRLQGRKLSKEERFDHPRNRAIYASISF
jgi:hypothetical protein